MRGIRTTLALVALLAAGAVPAAAPQELTLDRVVIVMRHGVRPPTKAVPMPAETAADPWPSWSVPPGHLTVRGGQAIALLGSADRLHYRRTGLLPARGCVTARIIADSDQRTIATARFFAEALQPGCATPLDHKPEGETDPRFSPFDAGLARLDPAKTRAALLAPYGAGGVASVEARLAPALTRLDAILCGAAKARCGLGSAPTTLDRIVTDARPKIAGRLDRGSTAAQILLLEYADGKPMGEVGWGRATAADVTALSALHAAEFEILARPRYVAAANFAPLATIVRAALSDAGAPAVTVISGHDTNVANLGGLLNVHWRIPGFAADDPSPGGAIVIERLRDARGRLYARIVYRSQTLDGIRTLDAKAIVRQPLRLPDCDSPCPLAAVLARLSAAQ